MIGNRPWIRVSRIPRDAVVATPPSTLPIIPPSPRRRRPPMPSPPSPSSIVFVLVKPPTPPVIAEAPVEPSIVAIIVPVSGPRVVVAPSVATPPESATSSLAVAISTVLVLKPSSVPAWGPAPPVSFFAVLVPAQVRRQTSAGGASLGMAMLAHAVCVSIDWAERCMDGGREARMNRWLVVVTDSVPGAD